MTVRRSGDAVLLEDVCPVDDAEILMQHLQTGAAVIDWSGCAHLHTACLQVILAARLPVRGATANVALLRWIQPLLPATASPEPETALLMKA
jgi:hypothetical protein